MKMFDVQKVRADFPILSQKVNGKPLVYFDNGATSQKPQVVIEAISKYYSEINANIHRGAYDLSERSEDLYHGSKEAVVRLINARETAEISYCYNATAALNTLVSSLVRSGQLKA